ncbi:BglG family transcription antiterminator [Lentibacillus sediminis]|uniref:BglG family transcription antiterminator n=1 Tax=Lentibacillus sediminis TaxID=1940529 RepID=UPI000C1BE0B6|nr:BglG family transcription antiterminator [Lentibacillus sediminis]
MHTRWQEIVEQMLLSDEPMTSSQLAKALQVSSRTVRNDIKEMREFLLGKDMHIRSHRGRGFELADKQHPAWREIFLHPGVIPIEREERVQYLMERLLLQSDYIKIDTLADELFVSRFTLQSDLKKVREILEGNQLVVDHRPHYGIKVLGEESQIRFCISEHIFNQQQAFLEHSEQWKESLQETAVVKDILLRQLRKHRMPIPDISLQNLITHIIIACQRLRDGYALGDIQTEPEEMKEDKEYSVAAEILKEIESVVDVRFPEKEIWYLAMHLQGTKLMNPGGKQEGLHHLIDHEIREAVQEIVRHIDQVYDLSLAHDKELLLALSLHLKPAINRFRHKMNLRNPLLEEIKAKYPLSFEAALTSMEVIASKWQIEVDENEIGYIALHLEAALERMKKGSAEVKRCLIVCASGMGSAQLLLQKLKSRFGDTLNIVGTTEYYNLEQHSLTDIDFLVSTIPIHEKIGIPVVYVRTILGDKDVENIEGILSKRTDILNHFLQKRYTFLQQHFDTPRQVIEFLGRSLMEDGKVTEDYIASVLERESYAPTSFGNLTAIPHPLEPTAESSCWSIATLEKPIHWGDKPVQLVVLLNVSKNDKDEMQPMFDMLSRLLDNQQLIHTLLECTNYQEFRSTITRTILGSVSSKQ